MHWCAQHLVLVTNRLSPHRHQFFVIITQISVISLQWRHNGRGSVSNHQPNDCLLNRLFRRRSEKNIKVPRHWPLCGEFTGTGEFPAQMASNAEIVSSWWRHHVRVRKSDVSMLIRTTITVTQVQRLRSSNWYEKVIGTFILATKVGIAGFKWIRWLCFNGSMTLISVSWQLTLLWRHMSFRAAEITRYSTVYLKACSYWQHNRHY